MTTTQVDSLKNASSRIGEMFDDYLIITRAGKHQIMVACSDSTWAIGATKRFATLVDEDTRRSE